MAIFPSLMIGTHDRLKAVSFHQCEEVRIKLNAGTECLSLDGNLYGINASEDKRFLSPYELPGAASGEMHFTIMPRGINIYL